MTDHRPASALARPRPGQPLIIAFDESSASSPRWADRIALDSQADLGWISLADPDRSGFYGGVPGLGSTIEAAVQSLRAMIAELAPGRIMTLGGGVAGHAALVYGVLLGADRIIVVEPLAHLIDEVLEQYHDRRMHPDLASKPDQTLARRCEVVPLMGRVGFPGEAHVLLGSRRVNDHPDAVHLNAIHAEWLAQSPRVTLHRFDQFAPGLVEGANDHEAVNATIHQLLTGEASPVPPASSPSRSTAGHRPLVYDAKLTICRFEADNPANPSGALVAFAAAGTVDETATRKMSDELRRWLVENLLLDGSPDDLATSLLPLGISRRETLREVDLARFHPYMLATQRPVERLVKRDWLLATYRKLDRLRRQPYAIERQAHLSSAEFLKKYYSTGRPVLLTGAIADWPALRTWASGELTQRLGSIEVRLTPDGADHEATTLADALDKINNPGGGPSYTLQAHECGANHDFWNQLSPDLGPHFDGFALPEPHRAYAWFGPKRASPPPIDPSIPGVVAQIVGRVRARVVFSWDVELMKDRARTTPVELPRSATPTSFPPLDQPEVLEFTMNPGDLLFLPAGTECGLDCLEPAASVAFPGLSPRERPVEAESFF